MDPDNQILKPIDRNSSKDDPLVKNEQIQENELDYLHKLTANLDKMAQTLESTKVNNFCNNKIIFI